MEAEGYLCIAVILEFAAIIALSIHATVASEGLMQWRNAQRGLEAKQQFLESMFSRCFEDVHRLETRHRNIVAALNDEIEDNDDE